jgi:PAS domain-containing protein
MRNLLDSSKIPTLFLHNDLRLKRYTAQATPIARLIATDVGRPITDIAWSLRYDTLAEDVKQVLESLVVKQTEVVAEDGSTYTMRIHPYRTLDGVIDGVVITFMDISAVKREAAKAASSERGHLVDAAMQSWPGIAYVEEVLSRRSIAISAATERLLGYPRSVLESATEDFWTALRQTKPAPRGTARRVVHHHPPAATTPANVSLRHADGQVRRSRERTVALVSVANGHVTHVLHTFRPLRATARAGAS